MQREAATKQYEPRCYCNQRFNVLDTASNIDERNCDDDGNADDHDDDDHDAYSCALYLIKTRKGHIHTPSEPEE